MAEKGLPCPRLWYGLLIMTPNVWGGGLNKTFFLLTVCTFEQYLTNNSQKTIFPPIDSNAEAGLALIVDRY